ncbi:MAG TPA: FHA domain-containing protein, partial [Blastocatellia bacterium]|nr:FHA domain-containing protein [Blastocatellia bacterium]
MRIIYYQQGQKKEFEKATDRIMIGRLGGDPAPDLDLSPDLAASRVHALIALENGRYWIEDLDSLRGTQVNGQEIKGQGRRQLQPADRINIGETTLYVQQGETFGPLPPPPSVEPDPYAQLPTHVLAESLKTQAEFLDASAPAFDPRQSPRESSDRRLALFYELALKFGEETNLDSLLQLIIEQVMRAIPGAKRGALLLKDRHLGRLLLKAAMPADYHDVSMTIALQAMQQRKAFIWPPPPSPVDADAEGTRPLLDTIIRHSLKSAMYAPLPWKDEVLGVVCVDNHERMGAFDGDDLRLLQAVAHHAAMAVAHHYAQEDLRRHVEFTSL